MTTTILTCQCFVILLFGAAGVAACRKATGGVRNVPFDAVLKKARHLCLALPPLLLLPAASVYISANPSWHWDLPWILQLHYGALHYGLISGILSYVFGFCCMAGFLTRHRWKWPVTAFAILVLCTIQVRAWQKARSDLPVLSEPRISADGVIMQSCSSTCVPAAAANIARLLGVSATEKELVELFHTTQEGTFPAQAVAGLKRLGISGRKLTAADADIGAVKAPAMLFVLGDRHAVVYVSVTNGIVEIWDPSSGKRFIPQKRLGEFWQGHALEFDWSARKPRG